MDKVAALVVDPKLPPGATFVEPEVDAAHKLDYKSALFGASDAVRLMLTDAEEEGPRKKRSYKWMWYAGAGVVVVGGALALGLSLGLDNGRWRIDAKIPGSTQPTQ
jgi:hypothetical protein